MVIRNQWTRSRDCSAFLGSKGYTYLSHSVGLVAVHNGSGSRAVSGIGSDNLGGVDGGSIRVVGRHTSHEGGGGSSSNGEAHGDDLRDVSLRIRVVYGLIELVKSGFWVRRESDDTSIEH